jgi:quercetin dioxygenase-like cupin family protein
MENERYVLEDNDSLETLTVSKTRLKPNQETRGHSHDDQDEVYIFLSGVGEMIVDDTTYKASPGSLFYIEKGKFHKVKNPSENNWVTFLSIFPDKRKKH